MEEPEPRLSGMYDLDTASAAPLPPTQPVGVYGWRKRCLYACVVILLVSVVVNLALTVWILRVLHFSWDGLGNLKINPDKIIVKGETEFLKPVYTEAVRSKKNQPLYMMSHRQVKLISTNDNKTVGSEVVVDKDTISAKCKRFHVQDMDGVTQMVLENNKVRFGSSDISVPGNVQFEGSVSVPSVTSPIGEPLELRSDSSQVHVFGVGGVTITSAVGGINLSATDINIETLGGQLKLDSKNIFLKGVPKYKAPPPSSSSSRDPFIQQQPLPEVYQLCVCKNRKLFLARDDQSCLEAAGVCSSP